MTATQLTPAQHAVLAYAIEHTGGKIDWYPDHIKGGARKKVLDGLSTRALITVKDNEWVVSNDGYVALGRTRPVAASATLIDGQAKTPRTRDNTKQATVIAMLKRPEGATIAQICEVTGWQAHTVRGTLAGAFKKKLGLTIVSEKTHGGERVYRIA